MMQIDRRCFVTMICGGLLSSARPSLAHGFHAAFTVIEHNPRSGALEIIHRLFTQDLDLALTARTGREDLLDGSPMAENLVEEYLHERFRLQNPDGRGFNLDWVGMEINADSVMIYQEVRAAGVLTGLVVSNQILAETHPQQVNTVNVTLNGRTKTLIFNAGDPPQPAIF